MLRIFLGTGGLLIGFPAHPPSEYLRKIWYDTVVFDDLHLAQMINRVGPDRIMFGTDYTFDIGDYDPARIAGAIKNPVKKSAVMGATAAELFGLSKD